MEPERKDFWDEFASVGEQRATQAQATREKNVGVAAMKKTNPGGGKVTGPAKDDEWEQW